MELKEFKIKYSKSEKELRSRIKTLEGEVDKLKKAKTLPKPNLRTTRKPMKTPHPGDRRNVDSDVIKMGPVTPFEKKDVENVQAHRKDSNSDRIDFAKVKPMDPKATDRMERGGTASRS